MFDFECHQAYGTRNTSALAVKASGEVFFQNGFWKENTETYMIMNEAATLANLSKLRPCGREINLTFCRFKQNRNLGCPVTG
ncbi:hypothetical protein LXL04_023188 [Taraxacum kok-saghyz]